VVKVIEDGQGLLPRVAGGVVIAAASSGSAGCSPVICGTSPQ
jgi:hypothetical protein